MSQPRSLASLLPRLARGATAEKGPLPALIGAWEAVVGADWARRAVPEALSFPRGRRDGATLRLRVDPADAILMQHDAPALIARVNAYFGYAAVARLALVQRPLDRRGAVARRPPRPLSAAEETAIADMLAGVDDPAWRARLASLGRAVYARSGGSAAAPAPLRQTARQEAS